MVCKKLGLKYFCKFSWVGFLNPRFVPKESYSRLFLKPAHTAPNGPGIRRFRHPKPPKTRSVLPSLGPGVLALFLSLGPGTYGFVGWGSFHPWVMAHMAWVMAHTALVEDEAQPYSLMGLPDCQSFSGPTRPCAWMLETNGCPVKRPGGAQVFVPSVRCILEHDRNSSRRLETAPSMFSGLGLRRRRSVVRIFTSVSPSPKSLAGNKAPLQPRI